VDFTHSPPVTHFSNFLTFFVFFYLPVPLHRLIWALLIAYSSAHLWHEVQRLSQENSNQRSNNLQNTTKKMKTKHIATSVFALLALSSGSLMAQNNWYFGGGTNTASNFTLPSIDNNLSIGAGWRDAFGDSTAPDFEFFGSGATQVSRPNLLGEEEAVAIWSFTGLTHLGSPLTSADVGTAILHLRQSSLATTGIDNTYTIGGLVTGNAAFDTSAMSWNDINDGGAGDWTGGTLGGSITGSFGSFTATPGFDTLVSIDLTDALKAYLDGTIDGIVLYNFTDDLGALAGSDNAFIPYSNDNLTQANRPGLLVTIVPEPSTALLGAIGALALLRRRRN
jgi:hypothetical protein